MSKLENFLDKDGRVKAWPSKKSMKIEVLKHISGKFEIGRTYTEKEVNEAIEKWHTFGDYFILRRGMVDYKLLRRTRDGSSYWKEKTDEE